MNAYDIIIKPILSEKSYDGISEKDTPSRLQRAQLKRISKTPLKKSLR